MSSHNLREVKLPVKLVPAVLIILLLFYTGSHAVRSLASEATSYPAILQLYKGQKYPGKFTAQRWSNIQGRLEKSLHVEPGKPELLHHLGNVHMVQYRYASDSDGRAIAARQLASGYFRQAIELRPTWPHDRYSYLLASYRLGEISEEFNRQLLLLNRLGPWEAGVQQITAEIGLQLGDQLPPDIREIVTASIINGVRHPDGYKVMLGLLRRYNSLDLVCGKVTDKNVTDFCNRNLK